jgi:coenzyme F420 hydrogenase subunit beta
MKSFKDIDLRLCHGCGNCVGVCPADAVSMDGAKPVLTGACTACELCYDSCPGIEFSYPDFKNYLFVGSNYDVDIGNYTDIYFGRAQDQAVRNRASSGGMVTAILTGLLKEGVINAAVVVQSGQVNSWQPRVDLAQSARDIISAAQSKYSMVPLNTILKDARRFNGKIALVGLPCHIHGIRKLQKMQYPGIGNIKYCIGLFCGFNLDKKATDFLLGKLKIDKKDILNLEYRGGLWPGGFRVSLKDGRSYSLGKDIYNYLELMFTPGRCLLCPDLSNDFADISVGDAWDTPLKDKRWSSVIVRTEAGREALSSALKRGDIELHPAGAPDIKHSHAHLIAYKKKGFFIRQRFSPVKPDFGLMAGSISKSKPVFNLLSVFLFFLMRNRFIYAAISYIPLRFIVFLSRNARRVTMRLSRPRGPR